MRTIKSPAEALRAKPPMTNDIANVVINALILRGTLEVTLGFERYRLDSGDSISFDSTRPHRLTNVGDVPVEAIWFNLERFDSPN